MVAAGVWLLDGTVAGAAGSTQLIVTFCSIPMFPSLRLVRELSTAENVVWGSATTPAILRSQNATLKDGLLGRGMEDQPIG